MTTTQSTWRSRIPDVVHRQLPYAARLAVNATAVRVREVQLEEMPKRMTIRRPAFAKTSLKVNFAKAKETASLVGFTGIPGRNDVLGQLEAQRQKIPLKGGWIAIPRVGSLVKPRGGSIVPDHLRPDALRQSLTIRTFVKDYAGGRGIFGVDRRHEARLGERTRTYRGRLRGDRARARQERESGRFLPVVRGRVTRREAGARDRLARRAKPMLLYALERSARVAPRLEFVPTARQVVTTTLPREMQAGLAKALATARWADGLQTGSVASQLGRDLR